MFRVSPRATGSLPAAGLTLILVGQLRPHSRLDATIKLTLALALLLTAAALLSGLLDRARRNSPGPHEPAAPYPVLRTIAMGSALGVLVTLSSIGAGALGTVALVALYPRFPIQRIVGTDIAHAVPLTLVAGMGHLGLGHVDLQLLLNLLLGSIPGIWIGASLSSRVSERFLRPILAILLLAIAGKMVL